MDIFVIVLQVLLGLMFLMASVMKIGGAQMHVQNFTKWQLPQWFRVVTGILEFAVVVGLIGGLWMANWATYGALLLIIIAIGGVITHVRVKDTFKETVPIIIVGILAGVLLVLLLQA